jgi:hypothetical protein
MDYLKSEVYTSVKINIAVFGLHPQRFGGYVHDREGILLHSVKNPLTRLHGVTIPLHQITVEQSCNNVELFYVQTNNISCEIMYLI